MWPKDRPAVRLVKHHTTTSLRDASNWAIDQICTVVNAHHLDLGQVEFTLEYLDGGIQGWHVRYSSASEHWRKSVPGA